MVYEQTTRGIKVEVEPDFDPDRTDPDAAQFVWTYEIVITNESEIAVQLRRRHWVITDARGQVEEVEGEGVVGQQPILEPGDSFRYASGAPLSTPSGIMAGAFHMVDADGHAFKVQVPTFSLDSPYADQAIH